MPRHLLIALYCLLAQSSFAQSLPAVPFTGNKTMTYEECLHFYKSLAANDKRIRISAQGPTDAGLPLQLVLYSNHLKADPQTWNRDSTIVVLVNNGIHPGEPDGIEASCMLLRDISEGRIRLPDRVALAIIPAYNIGGMLNRNDSDAVGSRVNQDGPEEYGFRGNSQNLDLNRDFTKCDSREATSFAEIFHWLDPNILIDTHVSDGADYQHTMTLLTTQYEKLGGALGAFLRADFDPLLYRRMAALKDTMVPYVNVEESTPDKGWTAFYDPPRFSSGYAALWQCIAFVPETHMLKPFADRVNSTYRLLYTIIDAASKKADLLINFRQSDRFAMNWQDVFVLNWKPDTTKSTPVYFRGYEPAMKASEVTGAQRLYYDHRKPFSREVPVRNFYRDDWTVTVTAPNAYIIPQCWHGVISHLKQQGVRMSRLQKDTTTIAGFYHIDSFETRPAPYEGHYKHSHIAATGRRTLQHFSAGDFYIPLKQPAKRFIIEMLEPTGEDSYFAWNFFDAIFQQKEGYSDYRWEDVAAEYLKMNPLLKVELDALRSNDKTFTPEKQLRWVYEHSDYFERPYRRYPAYRVEW